MTTKIVGKGWSVDVPDQVAQDMKDGAALRRLREALPLAVRFQVVYDAERYGLQVAISTPDYVALAPTVAEAAADVLEALR